MINNDTFISSVMIQVINKVDTVLTNAIEICLNEYQTYFQQQYMFLFIHLSADDTTLLGSPDLWGHIKTNRQSSLFKESCLYML